MNRELRRKIGAVKRQGRGLPVELGPANAAFLRGRISAKPGKMLIDGSSSQSDRHVTGVKISE